MVGYREVMRDRKEYGRPGICHYIIIAIRNRNSNAYITLVIIGYRKGFALNGSVPEFIQIINIVLGNIFQMPFYKIDYSRVIISYKSNAIMFLRYIEILFSFLPALREKTSKVVT